MAQFAGAPPHSTYVPAHIEDGKLVPGRPVTAQDEPHRLRDAPWLTPGSAGAAARRARPRRRGSAGRRRRRAQRAAWASRRATSTSPPRRCLRRSSAGPSRPASRRSPTGIEHGTVTVVVGGTPFEVTTLAPGHRDLRPQGDRALRPRLEGRRRAARLHHERAVGVARRRRARLRRRSRRPRGAPRALHRRSADAHPRGLSAHPALLPLPRGLRTWRARMPTVCTPRSCCATGSTGCRASASAWS